jgi:hypothetical protein
VTARSGLEGLYERFLGWQIRHVPLHIAIIQDGNRRFARARGLGVGEGHRLGADTTERVLDWAADMGVRYITLYSFSTENFRRDSAEVEGSLPSSRSASRRSSPTSGSTGGASGSGSSATGPSSPPTSWSGWRPPRRRPGRTGSTS